MDPNERPLAHPGREEFVRQHFPVNEMSPEEYAARHGANMASFSFDSYRYQDAALDEWIQRLGRIFFTPGELRRCQEQFLSAEELQRVRARMEEPF